MKPTKSIAPTSSQVSYVKVLQEQAVRGLRGIPGWLPKDEALSDEQLAALDRDSISTLIDALKSRKPFTVERYGNGTAKVIKKSAFERIVLQGGPARGNLTRSASLAERVAARYLRQSR